jgi:hypothetical protein
MHAVGKCTFADPDMHYVQVVTRISAQDFTHASTNESDFVVVLVARFHIG